MAKSSTRRVTIYINGKEVEASVKQIRSEMNKLVNEQNRMVIGSDEYIFHAKKIKELRQYLKEHAQNIGSAASAWSEMYNKVLQFGTGIGGLTQILSSLDNVTSTLKQVATDLAAMVVSSENPNAQRLYESLGFRFSRDMFLFGEDYRKMRLERLRFLLFLRFNFPIMKRVLLSMLVLALCQFTVGQTVAKLNKLALRASKKGDYVTAVE